MNSDEREVIENRIKELREKLNAAVSKLCALGDYRPMATTDALVVGRLEGNIGALEWCLREFPDERHITGCICGDCANAAFDARND